MPQFLNLSTAIDGDLTINSPTTFNPGPVIGSITAGSKSLTTTGTLAIANGDMILVHQTSAGSNPGKHDMNIVVSGAGTSSLTLAVASDYTYTNAQIYPWKQYGNVNINSTLIPAAWGGSGGGILGFSCSVLYLNSGGSLNADGKGFKGGSTLNPTGRDGQQGDGYPGTGSHDFDQRPPNGNGGGGGTRSEGSSLTVSGGGGGGNGTAGTFGWNLGNSGLGGEGGLAVGTSDLVTMHLGGGGGRGASGRGKYGGAGGGIIYIIANEIIFNGGTVSNVGLAQTNPLEGGNQDGDGGGGAGGSVLFKAINCSLGTNNITTIGGPYGNTSVGPSGTGGLGRIRVEACSMTGNISDSLGVTSFSQGGFPFCQSYLGVIF